MNKTEKTMKANERLAQEAWDHLSKTRKKSLDGRSCVYTGSGCAFTPAILPEKIDDAEGACASHLIYYNSDVLKPWAKDIYHFFASVVQRAHDRCENEEGDAFVDEFRNNLSIECTNYGVKKPEGL